MSQPSNLVLEYLVLQIGTATPISKLQVAEKGYQATMMSGEAPTLAGTSMFITLQIFLDTQKLWS